ncbi:MAG: hypothetical protein RPT95_13615 [Candidatus Sedimenticola sp. (ex Thyasira tokunagai)]
MKYHNYLFLFLLVSFNSHSLTLYSYYQSSEWFPPEDACQSWFDWGMSTGVISLKDGTCHPTVHNPFDTRLYCSAVTTSNVGCFVGSQLMQFQTVADCPAGSSWVPSEGACSAPCSASDPNIISEFTVVDFMNPSPPDTVSLNGCLYIRDPTSEAPGCQQYADKSIGCFSSYEPLGESGNPTPGSPDANTPDNVPSPPETTSDEQNAQAETISTPLTDLPPTASGEPQQQSQEQETVTKAPFKAVTNKATSTEIITVSGEKITRTTTTTTTTHANGSSTTHETVTYNQDPVTVTKAEIEWSTGTSSGTTSTYPGKSGTTTETTTTGADGSSTTVTSSTGLGGTGTGSGTGTGVGPGDQEGEEEAEEAPFNGGELGDVPGFGESIDNFYSRANNSPLGSTFKNLGAGAPSAGSAACDPLGFESPWGYVSTTIHCTIFSDIINILSTVMILVWTLVGILVVASA